MLNMVKLTLKGTAVNSVRFSDVANKTCFETGCTVDHFSMVPRLCLSSSKHCCGLTEVTKLNCLYLL